ncbi:MAG: hypothetical protein JWQ21_3607 [Herminiimonas sp.]|nr:hypothetical protein [Herminiimonas sp.]
MSPERCVHPETLDLLAATDPRAIRSRADLRRINRVMGTRGIVLRALRRTLATPARIIELGAGDGTLMLDLARRLAGDWPAVHLTLLDRQNLVTAQTIGAFHDLGWKVDILSVDVLAWLLQPIRERYDLALANLFVHHFDERQLPLLLAAIAERADAFFACEPRRTWLPLAGSHLTGLIGANAVTREDAVLSVHAGFAGTELSALWPVGNHGWHLREYSAGLFSHCFLALRQNG